MGRRLVARWPKGRITVCTACEDNEGCKIDRGNEQRSNEERTFSTTTRTLRFRMHAYSCPSTAHIRHVPFLPHNYRIGFQVAHVDRLALGNDVGMGRRKEPPHVSKEETPLCVMRIRVGFAVLVVHPVVQRPRVHVPLRKGETIPLKYDNLYSRCKNFLARERK